MSIFHPGTLDSNHTERNKAGLVPEHRLMAAVLSDAIDCYRRNLTARSGRPVRLRQDAEAWLYGEDTPNWTFSFHNICAQLGLDPNAVRAQTARWKRPRRWGR